MTDLHTWNLPPNESAHVIATHPIHVDVSYDLTPWELVDVHHGSPAKEVPLRHRRRKSKWAKPARDDVEETHPPELFDEPPGITGEEA